MKKYLLFIIGSLFLCFSCNKVTYQRDRDTRYDYPEGKKPNMVLLCPNGMYKFHYDYETKILSRKLISGINKPLEAALSYDGSKVALLYASKITIVDDNGVEINTIPLSNPTNSIGWCSNGTLYYLENKQLKFYGTSPALPPTFDITELYYEIVITKDNDFIVHSIKGFLPPPTDDYIEIFHHDNTTLNTIIDYSSHPGSPPEKIRLSSDSKLLIVQFGVDYETDVFDLSDNSIYRSYDFAENIHNLFISDNTGLHLREYNDEKKFFLVNGGGEIFYIMDVALFTNSVIDIKF